MTTTIVGVLAGLAVLVFTVEMLRRSSLREKYAVLWLVVAVAGVVFTVFPGLFARLSAALGFEVPANLVFALAAFVLLVVGIQLSIEVGHLEDRSQRLAEEIALLRLDLDRVAGDADEARRPGTPNHPTSPTGTSGRSSLSQGEVSGPDDSSPDHVTD